MTWLEEHLFDCWEADYEFGQPACEIEDFKILHQTPLAMLIECNEGQAWFPFKVAWTCDDILYYEWWFSPKWRLKTVSSIEGDYV